jgi:hypothetical protein
MVGETHNQSVSLLDVCGDLWRARFFILIGGFMALGAGFAFLIFAVPYYKATMLVSPANTMNGAESSSLGADDSLYALRYLVQRMGAGNSSDFARFENIYSGTAVATILLADPKVRAGFDLDQRFAFSGVVVPHNAEEMAEYLRDRVRLEPVGTTSMRRLVYWHPHPEFAKYFLHSLHKVTDELIRQRVRRDAEARVSYLQNEMQKNTNPDHRRALTTLLMEQERLRMLVSIDMPYAAAVVEAPAVGARPQWPDMTWVIAGFSLVGMVLGFLLHTIVSLLRGGDDAVDAYDVKQGGWVRTRKSNQNNPPAPPPVLLARDAAQ